MASHLKHKKLIYLPRRGKKKNRDREPNFTLGRSDSKIHNCNSYYIVNFWLKIPKIFVTIYT